jgi:hypothetical protein
MTRPMSIFIALFAIVAVITLIGIATRTTRFATLRDGLGRQVRSAMDVLDDTVEEAEAEAAPGAKA